MSNATFLTVPCPKCGATMRYAGSTPAADAASASRLHHYVCTSPDCGARFALDRSNALTETVGSGRPQIPFTQDGDLIRLQTNGLTLALVPRSLNEGGETIVLVDALPGIEAANPHVEFIRVEEG
jgi:hypothetical protein